jgi:divalent metal cation (Fe/Co/Zn/Cd) transporter
VVVAGAVNLLITIIKLIAGLLAGSSVVDAVEDLLTMHLGPDQILVAAKINFSDDISADQAEDVAGEIDERLRERLPIVRHVFLDPTQRADLTQQPDPTRP